LKFISHYFHDKSHRLPCPKSLAISGRVRWATQYLGTQKGPADASDLLGFLTILTLGIFTRLLSKGSSGFIHAPSGLSENSHDFLLSNFLRPTQLLAG